MKMVKSLLLGTAAGLVAIAGAQAADLPVKAKPVQYVKICSLYGAGFYYIPGTDTCIKLGGFLRTETGFNAGGSFATYINGASALYDRSEDQWITRTRAALTLDVREQTEYGTLRAYIRGGWQWSTADNITSNNNVTYFDRGFIQFAGFTTGKTASFFDFHQHAVYSYQTQALTQEAGGSATNVFAYTWQLGAGFSATIAAEDSSYRRAPVVDLLANGATFGTVAIPTFNATNPTDVIGSKAPDIVANARVDQYWGSAQAQAAAHIVGERSFGSGVTAAAAVTTSGQAHPNDVWGSAFGAGASFNLPGLGVGGVDTFSVGANWCNGAVRYCTNPAVANGSGLIFGIRKGQNVSIGDVNDGTVDGFGSGIELSRAWSISAGFQHYWSNKWKTALYGQYLDYKQNSGAYDSLVCATHTTVTTGTVFRAGGFGAGCADFKGLQVGTRTQWNPSANLDIGIDVMYTKAYTAYSGGSTNVSVNGASPVSLHDIRDVDVFSGLFRVQRNFYP